jgi:hypothetical protein
MTNQANLPETWRVWSDRDNARDVQAMLQEQLSVQPQPILIHRDPVNGPRRIPGFAGLATPAHLRNAVPLVEARLFYPNGLLHLVAEENGTRWAVWVEGTQEPDWFKQLGEPQAPKQRITVHDETVLLRSSPDRNAIQTGLGQALVEHNQLTVRMYYDAGILQWWRLKFDG